MFAPGVRMNGLADGIQTMLRGLDITVKVWPDPSSPATCAPIDPRGKMG